VSASKRKGTAFETAVVTYLRDEHGLPVERRALKGTRDCGDIIGMPGFVLECKCCARMELAAWMDEALKEAANDGAPFYVVVHKRKGKNASQAYVTMPLEIFAQWYREMK
jgi:Holliday junction resolvase